MYLKNFRGRPPESSPLHLSVPHHLLSPKLDPDSATGLNADITSLVTLLKLNRSSPGSSFILLSIRRNQYDIKEASRDLHRSDKGYRGEGYAGMETLSRNGDAGIELFKILMAEKNIFIQNRIKNKKYSGKILTVKKYFIQNPENSCLPIEFNSTINLNKWF